MKPQVIESTVEFPYGSVHRIRVWRSQKYLAVHYEDGDIVNTIKQHIEESRTPRACIDALAQISGVAAVQLVTFRPDGYQTGVVIYTEWP